MLPGISAHLELRSNLQLDAGHAASETPDAALKTNE